MPADSANVVSLTGDNDDVDATTAIAIRVTAADVATKGYYTVVVTRAGANASSDAKLAATDNGLVVTGVSLSPSYDPDKTAYTASVPYLPSDIAFMATAADTGAMVMATSDMDDDTTDSDSNDQGNVFDGSAALEVGANVITITVDAADAIATKTYTVKLTRASATASADANLSSLSLRGVTLSPEFDSGKTSYSDRVPNSVNLTTVTASAADSGAVVAIKSTTTIVGADGGFTQMELAAAFLADTNANDDPDSNNVVELTDLSARMTYILVKVTAENGVTAKYYIVEVTRAAANASSDAKLSATDSGLVVTGVSLSPSYDPDKTAYTASVPYLSSDIAFMATAADTGAMVMATSDMDDDTTDSDSNDQGNVFDGSAALEVGANVITITVDAADAIATKTYTVKLTRASATASTNANLSSLSLRGVTLSPEFDSGKTSYSDRVPNSVDLTTVTASAADSGAVVAIKSTTTIVGADGGFTQAELAAAFLADTNANDDPDSNNVVLLDPGAAYILIKVTAENGLVEKYYIVEVTRAAFNASDNASLMELRLDPDLDPAVDDDDLYLNMPFIPSRTDYTTTAERSVSSIIVATMPTHDAAIVMVSSNRDDEVKDHTADGTVVANAFKVDLEPGINVITIKVTAADAVSIETYTVTVTRAGVAVVSSDATLQALTLSGITLTPAFNPGTTAYTAEVEDIVTTTVEATATHPSATVMGTGERSLSVGDNRIRVTVTAEDGTSQTYTVRVTVLDEMVAPVGDLLERYDADDSGDIDLDEVSAAIDDFFDGQISLDDVSAVIDLYFG